MATMGQEWHNTNRSLGSRRSAETDDLEVPLTDSLLAGAPHSVKFCTRPCKR